MNERTIFIAALDIDDPVARDAYLDEACRGDTGVRKRVQALIDSHEQAVSFLDSPPPGIEATSIGPITETTGTMIGPYKLLEQIGEGGFGVVFMAEQTAPVKRKVALKVIKPGMDTREVIARFEAERQALALMDHPHIAKVLDAGATETGRPFFVMELVRGVPITDYCDQHQLTPKMRLELFVTVCQAVQHAHQKGIIHRDIKPTNVLVTLHDDKPVVNVIDFGIAKATSGQLTDKTLFTGFAQLVGTPLYMSPEQASMSGLDVDTRSDIYSLGVLLYELLTGTTPFDKTRLQQAAFDEVRRIIREEEPQKPSTRLSDLGRSGLPSRTGRKLDAPDHTGPARQAGPTSLASVAALRKTEPRKLSQLVKGDLDWIVMKALEKDRALRYETANGFAGDVLRYLADEPVEACPPSAAYRLRKFARRNKAGLAMAALILFFLISLGTAIGWSVRDRSAREREFAHERATRDEQAAREKAERRTRLTSQVELILEEVHRLEQEQKWPEALAAAQRAQAVAAGGEVWPEVDQQVRQTLRGLELLQRLEEIRLERSDTFDSVATDRAYTQAFSDYGIDVLDVPAEQAAALMRARPDVTVQLAVALDHWVQVSGTRESGLALTAVAAAADPDPWRRQVREAVWQDDSQPLTALATSPELMRQPPISLIVLATGLQQHGLSDLHVEFLRKAQRQYPGDFWINLKLSYALRKLGPAWQDEAISYGRAALAIRPRSRGANTNLGILLSDKGLLDEGGIYLRRALDIDPKHAECHFNLGIALGKQGKTDEAIVAYREAVRLQPDYAVAHWNLAIILEEQGELDEALVHATEVIRWKPADQLLFDILDAQGRLNQFADIYAAASNPPASERLQDPANGHYYQRLGVAGLSWHEAQRLCLQLGGHLATIDSQQENDFIHEHFATEHVVWLGGTDEAEEGRWQWVTAEPFAYQNWAPRQPDSAGAEHYLVMGSRADITHLGKTTWYRFGKTWNDQSSSGSHVDVPVVVPLCEWETVPPWEDPGGQIESNARQALAHYMLGNLYWGKGDLNEAAECYRRAIEFEPIIANAHYNLGCLARDQQRPDEAETHYRRAMELDPTHSEARNELGLILECGKKLAEAELCFRRAIELDPNSALPHTNLGRVLLAQSRPEEAEAYYRRGVELDPLYAPAQTGLGAWLLDRQRPGEAEECFRRAIELDPTNAKAHDNLGIVLCDYQRDYDGAIAAFREAIRRDPGYASAHHNVGVALAKKGDLDEAIAAFGEAARLDPDYAEALIELGAVLRHKELVDEAIACYRKAIECNPKDASSHNELAWLLANAPDPKFRNPARAVELAMRAVELSPSAGEYWNTLGAAHYRAGDWNASTAALERSMQLRNGGDSFDWFLLAMTHQQLGNQDEARQWHDRAVEWMDTNRPDDEELRGFRTEAAALLGIPDPPTSEDVPDSQPTPDR